jgi:hypothetical protein
MLTASLHIQVQVGQFYLTLAVVVKDRAVRSITATLLLPYCRTITFSSDNGSNLDRAITIRSDNDSYEPRAITIRSDNFSPQC